MRVFKTIDQVYGQPTAKRALTVAWAGGHSILLYGPRYAGKTTLREAFTEVPQAREMDPCPCGHYGSPEAQCVCSPATIRRWVLRFIRASHAADMTIECPALPAKYMRAPLDSNAGEYAAASVERARKFAAEAPQTLALDDTGERLMEMAVRRMHLSVGQHDAALRVARTIANMDQSPRIQAKHLAEAVQYQSMAAMVERDMTVAA